MATQPARTLALTRQAFAHTKTINWFPGHMAKGLRQMAEQLRTTDLVVETRDARIPLSSINPQFERLLDKTKTRRLIVYNKSDLAPRAIQATLKATLERLTGHDVVFAARDRPKSIQRILQYMGGAAQQGLTAMVVGMPNVGKSSLINALRTAGVGRGGAVGVGAKPGVTRSVSGRVRVSEAPPVYVLDTPGVMVPHIADPVTAVKVALTGGIKDDVADESVLADYLLYALNRADPIIYDKVLGIPYQTDDIAEFLDLFSRRIGALVSGGRLDTLKATQFFLRAYRDGKLGQMCLDDISEANIEKMYRGVAEDAAMSKNQLKKQKKQAQRLRALARAERKNLK